MVSTFWLQQHEVTNAQFEQFVSATGYITDSEKNLQQASGSAVFSNEDQHEGSWQLVVGATWRTPEGPGSTIAGREQHPVVHVSQRDARAYAQWAGARLPSETEWEYAARKGLLNPEVNTSGAFSPDGEPIANTWQGVFPVLDSGQDGFTGTAPIACFPPNKLGLYDMIGNVWEWTSTKEESPVVRGHIIKGGSYLCAKNYCRRYRPPARQIHETDFSTNHIGFRVAKSSP